jgi:hypothetical protein
MRRRMDRRSAALTGGLLALAAGAWCLSGRATQAQGQGRVPKETIIQGFQKGALGYKSIGALAFGPGGVLFFADDQTSTIYGVDLGETRRADGPVTYSAVPDLGATLGARLGTKASGIEIRDIAVSRFSGNAYLSVRKKDGADQNPANPDNYALFSVDAAGKVSPVDLSDKPFGKVSISADPGRDGRKVTDLAYGRGRLFVAARSKEQFDSNLVSVPLPFKAEGIERYATSIYHVSHKRQETASPIETLTTYRDGDTTYLMAAYTCTPVVRINLDDLKPGAVVKGTTVAELGSNNRPAAMVAYGRPGEQSLLLNNTLFGIVKVDAKIAKEQTAVNETTAADRGDRGEKPFPGIQPVESLKGASAFAVGGQTLLVVKPAGEGMTLEPMPLP